MKQKVLLIGLGVSGKSAAELLLDQGYEIVAVDQQWKKLVESEEARSLIRRGLHLLFEDDVENFRQFSFAVLSPGISPGSSFVKKVKESGLKITSEIELAISQCEQPILGITGTNGKTTTTLFVEHLLKTGKSKATALGNVGSPLAKAVKLLAKDEMILLELSSFQIDQLKTAKLDQAVVLNITPDHLDRYETMENYAKSKIKIAKLLKNQQPLIVNQSCYEEFKPLFSETPCITFGYGLESIFGTDLEKIYHHGKLFIDLPQPLKKCKSFELENFLAAVALTAHLDLPKEVYLKAYETFRKPKHRLAHVATISGIDFYNDSKGTNIDAVIKAVESIKKPIYLIAGGVDKGFPYTSWINAFEGKVKRIFAIGKAASIIAEQLSHRFSVEICESLHCATTKAYQMASANEAVLLSPGCASYDMFRDYADRGEQFERCVLNLLTHEGKP